MSETVFDMWFAVMGMTAVFAVIAVLTFAMVLSGSLFAGRGRKPAAPPRPREPRGEERTDGVPEEHVALISAALAIHRAELEADVVLLGGQDEPPWPGEGRRRVPPGQVPALRRTR